MVIFSEVAKNRPGLGALIASLSLVSIFGMMWLWRDTSDTARIASHAEATFWLVLPSLAMFLVLPALLRGGIGFWPSLVGSCVLTVALYFLMVWLVPKFGISL